MIHTIVFDKPTDVVEFCKFVCQLIREGVTFKIRQDQFAWEVELTGGF